MRRILLSVGVCLLLLSAQMGALLHELSHVSAASAQGVSVDAPKAVQANCALCLAYSQLANPASHSVPSLRFEPTACAAQSPPACADLPAAVPTARSRGPPSA
jgi:hypothetical protein